MTQHSALAKDDVIPDQENSVGNVGRGLETLPSTGIRGIATLERLAALAQLKAGLKEPTAAPAPARTVTQATLEFAAGKDPNELIHFTLVLPERPFLWKRFHGQAAAERASLVEERKADLGTVQQAIISRLEALGGRDVAGRWLANQIDVTLPARLAPVLASWPEIEHVERDAPVISTGMPGDGAYGGDRRAVVHADRLLSHSFDGRTGSAASASAPVRLGAIGTFTDIAGNTNRVPSSVPGFNAPTTLVSRFSADQLCSPTVQSCTGDWLPTAQTHETVVMGVMAGSIEAGQDTNFTGTGTAAQIDRSGIAPASQLSYYHSGANTSTAGAIAVQAAVNAGVDILNNSWGISSWTRTDPTTDFSGLNGILHNAFLAGVLPVFSAGNNNTSATTFSSSCNVSYPANRPDVLAINGMDTTYSSTGVLAANPLLIPGAWSTSGCTIKVWSGTYYADRIDRAIGGVAPGFVGLSYSYSGFGTFTYTGNWLGSSFAAPVVSGAAGLLRDAWQRKGYGVRPNYFLKTDLMMLTDGYDFRNYGDGGTYRLSGGVSTYSGPGRLQLRTPIDDFTSGDWAWGWTTLSIADGATWSKTVPANIQNYRFAMFWIETNLAAAADIDVTVDALNSSGSVCASNVAWQTDYSLINTIHIKRSDIPACALPNGNLRLTITGFRVPAGAPRQIYFSDLWDNESTY